MKRLSQYYSIGIVVSLLLVLFSSCSDSGYVDAIPAQSSAIVSVDVAKATGVQNGLVLKTLLKATDLGKTGIDVGRKIYLFETTDGSLGICAAVDDASRLSSTLEKIGCKIEEKRGYRFAVVAGSWLAGFSGDALLVMGPVPVSDVAVMQNRMARYLSQEEGQGVTGTSMFACLDTVNAPIAMIAQAAALPRQLVMPFTLGAPKDADPSQVIVSAAINISKGVMYIDGTTFSFNKRIDEALKSSGQRSLSRLYVSRCRKWNVPQCRWLKIHQCNARQPYVAGYACRNKRRNRYGQHHKEHRWRDGCCDSVIR